MKKSKWVVFKFLPYEYKAFQEYLESMALRGWKLESIYGYYIKFKKIEPQVIKYSVDTMDSISFFNGRNSENAIEYREYCKEAGWEFVCEKEKFQIYCSIGDVERVPIHTDESENFKGIFKASLKYIFLNLMTALILLWTQYNSIFIYRDANFLASNLSLISSCIVFILVLSEVMELINFSLWLVNYKFSITNGRSSRLTKIKRDIYKAGVFLAIFMIIFSIVLGEVLTLEMLIMNLVLVYALYKVKNLVEKSRIRKKKSINVIAYIVIFIMSFFTLNTLMFKEVFKERVYSSDNYAITLQDFNDKQKEDGAPLYINKDNSILASRVYYSEDGENINLSYELFESEYNWIIDYKFKCINYELDKSGCSLAKVQTSLPEEVNIYKNERNNDLYMLLNNKILELHYTENYNNEDELLKIVYEKLI